MMFGLDYYTIGKVIGYGCIGVVAFAWFWTFWKDGNNGDD